MERLKAEQDIEEITIHRPKRAQLTAEESLRRIEVFPERQEKIVATVRKSRMRNSLFPSVFVLIALSQMLCGCSGPDDLRITNNYPFTVKLWNSEHNLIGAIPRGAERDFKHAGGFKGDGLDFIRCSDEKNKIIGILRKVGSNIKREEVSWFNGTAVWSVTLGAAKPAPPLSAAGIFSAYWAPITILFALIIFMLHWGFSERKRRNRGATPLR